jgi:4-hydroxybenzoate polyprenyltransferase
MFNHLRMMKSSTLSPYWRLIRGDRPIGTLLLLWPTLVALFFAARGQPPAWPLAVFIAGTFLMRSAGCAINDWADRDFDRHVWRTANRPLAAGEIPPHHALWVAAGLALVALLLAATLGEAILLWSLPAAAVAAIYPFTKRFLPMPQAVLGVAFSFGIPMAFVAVRGEGVWGSLDATTFWLFLGNGLWTIAYDTAYAMADRPDDLKIGIRSSAILFGRWDVAAIVGLELAALAAWGVAGRLAGVGASYWLALVAIAFLWAAQLPALATREPKRAFQVFLDHNWAGLIWFLGTVFAWA